MSDVKYWQCELSERQKLCSEWKMLEWGNRPI